MAATNAALPSGGMTHLSFRCGLRTFFLILARSCCRWRAQRSSVPRPCLPAVPMSNGTAPWEVPNRPARSVWPPRHHRDALAGRIWGMLAGKDRVEAVLDQPLAYPRDGGDTG